MWVKIDRHTLAASMKNQNIHSEYCKRLSEALETCQTIEWQGKYESCNNKGMVIWWHADRQLSYNYEDVSNIPVNIKHQNEARQKQGKRKTQKWHRNTWVSKQQSACIKKHTRSLQDQMESQTKRGHTWPIQQYENLKSITTAGHSVHCHIYGGRHSFYRYLLTIGTRESHTLPIRGEG